ncbi:MAG: histidinol-phosphate transaminase [alpha proteobacterium HIMB59]|nr:MAG: histidinol-phosphate transaminase [alpha proteobacterium HIMB59]
MIKIQPKNSYQGGSENFKGFIRLSSNENNYGPSSKVISAIKDNSKYSNIYPELDGNSLKLQLAKTFKINSNQIILGAGSDEILQMAYAAFTKPGDEVLFTKYAFAMYSIYAKNFKCKAIKFNDKNLQFSLNDLLKLSSANTKIIFLANPNNPTGSIFYKKELINFLDKVNKKTIVILDDAYCEYIQDKSYDNGMNLVKKYPNLMITRSFSKIFALGGLRIGWGYSQLHNISKIYEFKKPFNVSRLSCIAGIESLKSKSWLKSNIQKNIINKNYTINNLKKIFFEIIDTKANFILLKFKNEKLANSYVNFLNKKKITVRSLTSYGLPNYIRMTIGTQSDMRKTVKISNKFNV